MKFSKGMAFHAISIFVISVFLSSCSNGGSGSNGDTTSTSAQPGTTTNSAPTANDDSVSTAYQTATAAIDVLANDTDPESDTLTVTSNTDPAKGTVAQTDNIFVYTPNNGATGADSFTYTISDGNSNTATATVNITIGAAPNTNSAPTAKNDSVSTAYQTASTAINVLANDSDPDNDTLSVTSNTNPTKGTVVKTGNTFVYTPNNGATGADSFIYTISDGNSHTDTATVNITIGADPNTNSAPTAKNDSVSTAYQTATGAINVLSNDSDPDNDTLSVTGNTNPTKGTVVKTGNTFVYTPNNGATGADSFTYTISDGNSHTDTATVNITIGAAPNLAPTANNDSVSTAFETSSATINVLTNDTDPENDTLTVTTNTNPGKGNVLKTGDTFVYTPNTGETGADSFTYTISDGNSNTDTATVNITIGADPSLSPPANASWALDENSGLLAQDQSVQGIDLTLNNGASWDTGRSGSALSFDGTNQDASNTNGASALQTPSVTLSAWVYPANTTTSWEWIAAQGDNYGLYLHPNSRQVVFYIKDTAGGWVTVSSPNNSFEFNQWQHITGSFDAATHTLKVYVNGVEVGTSSAAQAIQYDTGNGFTVGSMQGGRYFNGQIDEVQVFDSALNQAQINQLANVIITPPVDTTAPVITLNGANPVSVALNQSYTDAGATATDNVDGTVSVSVDQSAVDTSVAGSYTVQFSATDTAGNKLAGQ